MIGKFVKLLFMLAILGFIGLAGFAHFGDLSPVPAANNLTVTLDAD